METALVILVGECLTATEQGKTGTLLLLDPSTAFDTTGLSGAADSLTGPGWMCSSELVLHVTLGQITEDPPLWDM